MANKNLSYSLTEKNKATDSDVTYESLIEQGNAESSKLDDLNMDYLTIDDYVASEMDYDTNYTKKQLEFICDYYGISKRKKKKQELVEEICYI